MYVEGEVVVILDIVILCVQCEQFVIDGVCLVEMVWVKENVDWRRINQSCVVEIVCSKLWIGIVDVMDVEVYEVRVRWVISLFEWCMMLLCFFLVDMDQGGKVVCLIRDEFCRDLVGGDCFVVGCRWEIKGIGVCQLSFFEGYVGEGCMVVVVDVLVEFCQQVFGCFSVVGQGFFIWVEVVDGLCQIMDGVEQCNICVIQVWVLWCVMFEFRVVYEEEQVVFDDWIIDVYGDFFFFEVINVVIVIEGMVINQVVFGMVVVEDIVKFVGIGMCDNVDGIILEVVVQDREVSNCNGDRFDCVQVNWWVLGWEDIVRVDVELFVDFDIVEVQGVEVGVYVGDVQFVIVVGVNQWVMGQDVCEVVVDGWLGCQVSSREYRINVGVECQGIEVFIMNGDDFGRIIRSQCNMQWSLGVDCQCDVFQNSGFIVFSLDDDMVRVINVQVCCVECVVGVGCDCCCGCGWQVNDCYGCV